MLHGLTERKRLWLLLELKRQAGFFFFFLLSFLWKMVSCLLSAQTFIENSKYYIRTTYILGIKSSSDPKRVPPITPKARAFHTWSQGPVKKWWFPWRFGHFHSSWNCTSWYKIGSFHYSGFEVLQKSAKYWSGTSENPTYVKHCTVYMNSWTCCISFRRLFQVEPMNKDFLFCK